MVVGWDDVDPGEERGWGRDGVRSQTRSRWLAPAGVEFAGIELIVLGR